MSRRQPINSGSRKACSWFLGSGSRDHWRVNAVGLVIFGCCHRDKTGVESLESVFFFLRCFT